MVLCLSEPQEHLCGNKVNKHCMIDTIYGGNNKDNSRSKRSLKQREALHLFVNSLFKIFGGMYIVQSISEEILVNIHESDLYRGGVLSEILGGAVRPASQIKTLTIFVTKIRLRNSLPYL